MKCLILLSMLICTTVSAGPAIDRARAAMESFKGSPVSNAVALAVVTQWATSAEPRLKYTTTCVPAADPEAADICTTTSAVDPWTTEELAGMYLDKHYSFDLRQYNQYKRAKKRSELKSQQDALDAQVAAEEVIDL